MESIISLIIIFILIYIIIYFLKNKVFIKFSTLLKKGLKTKKDKFRLLLLVSVNRVLGKTYSCISYILDKVKFTDLKVITNVESFANNNKKICIYEPNFYNIIDGFNTGKYDTNYIIFYDEIFTLLDKKKIDKEILTFISQLRKRKIYLLTTAQEWLEINVTFRRYVRYQIDCYMVVIPILHYMFFVNEINDGYKMHWDNLQNEYVSPRIKTTIKKGNLKVFKSYDTYEVIKDENEIPISKYI